MLNKVDFSGYFYTCEIKKYQSQNVVL